MQELTPIKLDIRIEGSAAKAIIELNNLGYNSLVVGGAVRDALLGISPKDIDIEVYNIDYSTLEKILSKYGSVNVVGKSFGVIKFTSKDGGEYDFSVPRRESRVGVGHKGFDVHFDATMTPKDAAERRDFTFNALAYDPLLEILHDYYGGLKDLKKGIISATSEKFVEDPLRILRAMQFQSRMDMQVSPFTMSLMRKMVNDGAMDELPLERISEEWMKWAIKGKKPSLIFDFIHRVGLTDKLPYIGKMKGVPQDVKWHPEGDVEIHTGYVMDAALEIADREGLKGDDRAILIFAALCHDFAKPQTTEISIVTETDENGNTYQREAITARGHEKAGGACAKSFLEAIGIKYDIIEKVVPLVENHLEHVNIAATKEHSGMLSAVRKLSKRLFPANIKELLLLIEADASGRPPLPKGLPQSGALLRELSQEAGVEVKKQEPIIMGRHLIELGMKPSLLFGKVLAACAKAEEEGIYNTVNAGKDWVINNLDIIQLKEEHKHVNASSLKYVVESEKKDEGLPYDDDFLKEKTRNSSQFKLKDGGEAELSNSIPHSDVKFASGGRVSASRYHIPNVRGGWNKDKIIKYFKSQSSDTVSTFTLVQYIAQFDNWEEFKNHIYYHGTSNYIEKGLKPSITMSEREAERSGGGGYGERYFGISLTKRKRTAESFSGMSTSVTIYPVILKRDANVIERTDIKDASEIEDIIVQLYEQEVDAVWIGGGEEELVVVNPYSILIYKKGAEYHRVFGGFKSVPLTDEKIKEIYDNCVSLSQTYKEEYKTKQTKEEKDAFLSSLPSIQFEKGGDTKQLLAPNGKPSNLTPEQWHLVRTDAFKKWFGDWEKDPENASKVVDENGEPLVVYHGSHNIETFNIFETYKGKIRHDDIMFDKFYQYGSFFSDSKETAEIYSTDFEREKKESKDFKKKLSQLLNVAATAQENGDKKTASEYIEKYKKLSNAKTIFRNIHDDFEKGNIYEVFLNIKAPYVEDAKGGNWFKVIPIIFNDVKKQQGFDGFIVKNVIEVQGIVQTTFNAFNPEQIKLADGTNITFDINNPDIRFKKGGNTQPLLAPNGKPSNLTPEQWHLVRTDAFKQWFGDWEKDPENASKVVDENGEPKVMYHFTNLDFNVFELKGRSKGYFFTENEKDDEFSAEGAIELLNKGIKPRWAIKYNLTIEELKQGIEEQSKYKKAKSFFLSIKNIDKEIVPDEKWSTPSFENSRILKSKWSREKYDGIEFINEIDRKSIIVAYEPEQIKLADGTNTTFDPNNPDIRFKKGGNTNRLLAPNGKPSNLTPKQWHLVRTDAFRQFFGDWLKLENAKINDSGIDEITLANLAKDVSKVVDSNGEPMVCWHRSKIKFYEFRKSNLNGWIGSGFYFSPNKDEFKEYGRFVLPCFLSIKNIFKSESEDWYGVLNEVYGKDSGGGLSDITIKLQKDGYNGIIMKHWDRGIIINCFEPNNIKLADGNNTTFDPNNPDIRFEYGGETERLLAPNGKPSKLTKEQWHLVRGDAFKKWFGDWEKAYKNDDYTDVSKAIDRETKEPIVVFHGSPYGAIKSFDRKNSLRVSSGLKEIGTYFATNKKVAEMYAFRNTLKPEFKEEIKREVSKLEIMLDEVKNVRDWSSLNNRIKELESQLEAKIYPVFLNIRSLHTFNAKGESNIEAWYNLEVDAGYKIASGRDAMEFLKDGRFGVSKVEAVLARNIVDVFRQDKGSKEYNDLLGDVYLVFDGVENYAKLADGSNTTFDLENPDIRFKKGGTTIAQTPAPKKDRIYGSDKNDAGSASNEKQAKDIKFDVSTLSSISSLLKNHNDANPTKKVSLATAKAVVRRGLGAYSASHRPTISKGKPNSRVAWGLARLKAFLYKIENGKSKSGNYIQDDDLINELGYKVKRYDDGGNVYNYGKVTFVGDDFKKDYRESLIKFAKEKMKELGIKEDITFVFKNLGSKYGGTIVLKENAEKISRVNMSTGLYNHKKMIAHELVHVKQINNRELLLKDGNIYFKGEIILTTKEYKKMFRGSWNLKKYSLYNSLPWETEANNSEKEIDDEKYENGGVSEIELTKTPEFKKWFKKSKAVDENNQPIIYYHGTGDDEWTEYNFDAPSVNSRGGGSWGQGIYLTRDENEAKHFSKNGKVLKFFALSERPKKYDEPIKKADKKTIELAKDLVHREIENSDYPDKNYALKKYIFELEDSLKKGRIPYLSGFLTGKIYRQIMLSLGYDSVQDGINHLVVYNPNQIKLADGSNTNFDINSPDIRFEEGGEL